MLRIASRAKISWQRADRSERVRSRVGNIDSARVRLLRDEEIAVCMYPCRVERSKSGWKVAAEVTFLGTGDNRYKMLTAETRRALASRACL